MSKLKLKSGFTIFEMLVSVAVIILVSSVVFYNHSKFRNDTEVVNLAYKLALYVRQAQTYGISVKQFKGDSNFDISYGLHFNKQTDDALIFFADTDNDGLYDYPSGLDDMACDPNSSPECIEKIIIGKGNYIRAFCGIRRDGVDAALSDCFNNILRTDPLGTHGGDFLDVMFKRPNPDAILNVYNNQYIPNRKINTPYFIGWAICLASPKDPEKDFVKQQRIMVYETGQISVQNVLCGTTCANAIDVCD